MFARDLLRRYLLFLFPERAKRRHGDFFSVPSLLYVKGLRRSIVVYPSGKKLCTDEGMDVLPFNDFVQEMTENTLFP